VKRHPIVAAAAFFAALTILLTWPQALHLSTRVATHQDSFFSMWRLAWVAHAIRTDPRHLFDANIFYPHVRTLAYSDATLLEGILGAPLFWAHVSPLFAYNALLLGAIAASGIAMFLFVRDLTGNLAAAFLSGAIFTLAPYRIEHFMHLELQWTMWMPLTLWAVHRLFRRESLRQGAVVGVMIWLQTICCVYYGVYLSVIVVALTLLLALGRPHALGRVAGPLVAGALLAAALTLPYAIPYIENIRTLGPRGAEEVANFSARLDSYFLAPEQNLLWGWTGVNVGGNELHLFPGVTTVLLAVTALAHRRRNLTAIYAVIVALCVVLSFGFNTAPYRWLYMHIPLFAGFRAPARFGVIACCGLAVLAGFGWEAIALRLRERSRSVVFAGILGAIVLESWSAPMSLRNVSIDVPPVYKFLQTAHRPVVLELPWDLTPEFMYWSTTHWSPLVNGYSGYFPPDYIGTLALLSAFPDEPSIARLRELGVRYVLMHESFYAHDEYVDLATAIAERPEFVAIGRFRDWDGPTQIFELRGDPGPAGRRATISSQASCRPKATQSTREYAFPASPDASPCESRRRNDADRSVPALERIATRRGSP
jgi:hypothetical protein